MPRPTKVKVPYFGNVNRAAFMEDGATVGATLGVNLYGPDGSLLSIAELAALLEGDTTVNESVTSVIWRFIREIPVNVVELENLSTSGIMVRYVDSGGPQIVTREIVGAGTDPRIVVEEGDGAGGNPTLDLADVTPLGPGVALVTIDVDIYGRVRGATPAVLDDLADVDAPAPTDGYVLTWVDAMNEWQAVAPTGGGGGGGYPPQLGYAGI